jgi:L-iditol 2-dehydrogenase
MKALIYDGPMQLHVEEIGRPMPGPGEVVVRVRAVGICGSDVHGFTGASKRRVPGMVMGHELAGEIVEVGEGVGVNLRGQRVAVNPTIGCGECPACRAGKTNLCTRRRTIGVNMGTRGAFAEVVIAPAENCIPLAEHVSYALGALAEPLAVGLHAAHLAGAAPGRRMLIIGGGTIGLCTLLCARQQGATVYLTEPIAERAQLAETLGAQLIDTSGGGIGPGARAVEPEGMDVAIDAVGVDATLAGALEAVAYGGTVVWLGNAEPTVQVPCNPVLAAERILRGSYGYTVDEYRDAVDLINRDRVDLGPLVNQSCSLDEAPGVFTALARGENRSIKVIVEP